jgi:hypothetical protein
VIPGELYDNGFPQDQTQLLRSASKTDAGVSAAQLIDASRPDPAGRTVARALYVIDSRLSTRP